MHEINLVETNIHHTSYQVDRMTIAKCPSNSVNNLGAKDNLSIYLLVDVDFIRDAFLHAPSLLHFYSE